MAVSTPIKMSQPGMRRGKDCDGMNAWGEGLRYWQCACRTETRRMDREVDVSLN